MNKTILIDIDDTIEDLLSAWLYCLNNTYGYNVKPDDITEWDMSKFYPTLTKTQIYEPFHDENFWNTVEPKFEASKYIKKLIEDGNEVYLCTATDYRNLKPKYEAIIKKHFPFIDWKHIIVTYKKQMIKADYLIDDGLHNLVGGDYSKILFSAPHNLSFNAELNGMKRASTWKEVYEIIKGE